MRIKIQKGNTVMEQDNAKTAIGETVDEEQVAVGQIVSTMGRQIAVPYWHKVYKPEIDKMVQVGSRPCVKLVGYEENCHIDTGSKQSGLVCFVPKEYFGNAILSVKVTAAYQNSVSAEPVEWIEIKEQPFLTQDDIGDDVDEVFDRIKNRAIWHNRKKE